jgi:hypothetical protein
MQVSRKAESVLETLQRGIVRMVILFTRSRVWIQLRGRGRTNLPPVLSIDGRVKKGLPGTKSFR